MSLTEPECTGPLCKRKQFLLNVPATVTLLLHVVSLFVYCIIQVALKPTLTLSWL